MPQARVLNLAHANVKLYNLFQPVDSSDINIAARFLSTRTELQEAA